MSLYKTSTLLNPVYSVTRTCEITYVAPSVFLPDNANIEKGYGCLEILAVTSSTEGGAGGRRRQGRRGIWAELLSFKKNYF